MLGQQVAQGLAMMLVIAAIAGKVKKGIRSKQLDRDADAVPHDLGTRNLRPLDTHHWNGPIFQLRPYMNEQVEHRRFSEAHADDNHPDRTILQRALRVLEISHET